MPGTRNGTKPSETKTLYAELPPALHKALKHHAIDEGRSVSSVATEAIEEYLTRRSAKAGR